MAISEFFNGLQLDDDRRFDKQIEAMPANFDTTVDAWHTVLPRHLQANELEFYDQGTLINRFDESRAKFTMNRDRGTDDLLCQILEFECQLITAFLSWK